MRLLKSYANAGNAAADADAIKKLGNVIATDLPIIPIMYGAAWGEYNSSKITGFPSKTDPYDPAQPSTPYNEYVALQLHPAS